MPICNIDHLKLYYEEYGSKDQVPIIFIHGLMASSEIWKPQVEYFKHNRRIIIYDLRGHGQSDKPRERYSIEQFSDDLYSFMNSLKIGKAIIAGHSMGGMTVLRFTLDHQEMLDKIILIDTTPKSSYSLGRRLVFFISQIAMSINYMLFMKYYLNRVFGKGYPESEKVKALEKVLQNPKHVVKSCFSTIQEFDVLSELNKIQVPTLIIHGSQSINPLRQAMDMKEGISDAELVIIEGAGHTLTSGAPRKICEAIEKFVLKG